MFFPKVAECRKPGYLGRYICTCQCLWKFTLCVHVLYMRCLDGDEYIQLESLAGRGARNKKGPGRPPAKRTKRKKKPKVAKDERAKELKNILDYFEKDNVKATTILLNLFDLRRLLPLTSSESKVFKKPLRGFKKSTNVGVKRVATALYEQLKSSESSDSG